MSTVKVGILLAGLTALLVVMGNAMGGKTGMVIALLLAIVMNMGTYWFSDKIVLSMVRARPIGPTEAPELFEMTKRLADRGGIPMPRLFVVDDPSPNAFATGRNPQNGVVAVNTGLLQILSHDEVEGVIAHELGHIRARDTLTSAIVATIAGAIGSIASIARFGMIFGGGRSDEDSPNPLVLLVMTIIAPLAAMLIQFAVSRAREFEADKTAAELTGRPHGLVNALLKLERGAHARPMDIPSSAAHMCIVNPLSGGGFAKLFSTHPPIEERVRRLQAMA